MMKSSTPRRSIAFLREHRWTTIVLLGVTGFLLNTLSVPLFPNIDLIFGGVAYLLAAIAFGAGAGLVAAAIASLYTLWLWGHPYAFLIFCAEGLVVGYLVRQRGWRPLVADVGFWLVVGVPLIYLFYFGVLQLSGISGTIILLKQPFNGLLYTLIAEALLLAPWVRHALRVYEMPRLRSSLAVLIAVLASVPALGFGVLQGREEWTTNIEQTRNRVTLAAQTYAAKLEQYVVLHERAVRSAAQGAELRGEFLPEQLQRLVTVETEQFPGFLNMYAADSRGVTVAFDPPISPDGESRIGLDFSDRDYYRQLRETRQTVISSVFAGRGGAEQPLIVIAHPIIIADTLAGYVLGALDLERLPEPTGWNRPNDRLRVADAQGTLVVENDRPYRSGDLPRTVRSSTVFEAVRTLSTPGYVEYVAGDSRAPAAAAAQRVLAGVAPLPALGWYVWVEHPYADIQAAVASSFARLLVLLVGIILLALLLSHPLAHWLADPLLRVRGVSAALAEGDLRARVGKLPATVPLEISDLGRGFDEMANSLAERTRELEQLGEAAEAASRAKSDFIATMSHELRTPLNAMLGHLELLQMGIHGELSEAQEHALSRIEAASRHLRGLIEEVLSFSRLEAGRVEIRVEEVDLHALVEEVAAVIEPLALDRELRFRLGLGETPQIVTTDPDKVRQILINLAGNAVKFTERGEVRIAVEERADVVALSVMDTGPGIAEEDVARLFRPFEQLESGFARPHGGTGLGLYLSGRYAQLLGGWIEVETAPGEGSVFSLILPRTHTPAPHAEDAPAGGTSDDKNPSRPHPKPQKQPLAG